MKKKFEQTNKELKQALKNEVAPFLIGLRNDQKKTAEILERIEKRDLMHNLELIFNGEKIPTLKGIDGYNPVRGVDYWTESDQKTIIAKATPIRGIDYFTAKRQSNFSKMPHQKKECTILMAKISNFLILHHHKSRN